MFKPGENRIRVLIMATTLLSVVLGAGCSLLGAPQTWKQRVGFGLMNYHFMPGFQLGRDTLEQYVSVIRSKKVLFMRGYSTLLHQLAELCDDAGIHDLRLGGGRDAA